MKAFVLDRYGKQRPLQLTDMPVPTLRNDEVLVEVHATGVNLLDAKIRSGEFKLILRYGMPLVLGHDVAGVVVTVGTRAQPFKVGDEVYARVDDFRIGTFAEFVPVKASSLAPKPKSLTMAEAASLPLVGLTAWQALVEMAALKRGQSVFIQAGSGGVGTFAIQLNAQPAPPTAATQLKVATPLLADTARYDRLRGGGGADGDDSTGEATIEVVVDFKTGKPSERHRMQLLRYALLWWRATGESPGQVTAQYLNGAETWSVATQMLEEIEFKLAETLPQLSAVLSSWPSVAQPSNSCLFCASTVFAGLDYA